MGWWIRFAYTIDMGATHLANMARRIALLQEAGRNLLWPRPMLGHERRVEPDMMTIRTTCPMCSHHKNVKIASEDYHNWKHGMLIQDAAPYLDVNDREALITGWCERCWDELELLD